MSAATRTAISLLQPFQAEWASLLVGHPNVLLEGSAAATHAVLRALEPLLSGPIAWAGTCGLTLPDGQGGSLILTDVAALSAADQTRLLAWTGREGSRTQTVSMSNDPLFTAVTRGLFPEALYYRLNVILLRLT